MSRDEPTRWRDAPDPTSGAAVVLRGARRPRPPGADELARLGTAIGDLPRRSLATSLRNARLLTVGASAVTLLALGGGVWAWRGRHDATSPAPLAQPAIAVAPTARPAVAEAPASTVPAPRPQAHSAARVVRRAPVAAAPEVDALTREIALIDAARRDIAASPASALAAAEAHRRAFPDGQLGAEREFLAVEALRRLGHTGEARSRAAALAVRYPASSYATRATRLLQPAP